METIKIKPKNLQKKWLLIDAKDKVLGRLASKIATTLMGKHKPNYVPNLKCGDFVVVINADKVKLTGNKLKNKYYYHHSGYMGGLKAKNAKTLLDTYPQRVIQSAVKNMLPKNKLARHILKQLKIYKGSEHPHSAQKPQLMNI